MVEPFSLFLRRSLAAVRRECPNAWKRLTHVLDGRALCLEVDAEAIPVAFAKGAVHWQAAPTYDLYLTTNRAAILALIDGLSLADAVLTDRLTLTGSPDAVIRFDDALNAYLHGVVRSPSQPGLLRSYRSDTPADAS